MADLGLIGGIADGFKQGLESYQKQKHQNFSNKYLLAEMMAKGFQADDQGNLTPGPGLLAQQDASLGKAQYEKGLYSAEGPQAEATRQATRGLLNKQQDGFGDSVISDQMSPAAIKDVSGLIKPETTGVFGLLKGNASNETKKTIATEGNETKETIASEGNKTKKDIAVGNNQTKVQTAGMGTGLRQNNHDNTDWEKFAMTVNNPSARNAIGRYQNNVDKASTLNVLANQIGMPEGQVAPANETREQKIARFNNADPRQLYEVAKAADQLTSNAGNTVFGTDHMMPKDMDIGAAKLKEFMPIWAGGGKPAGTNAGEYIVRYLDSAGREGNYFQQQRNNAVEGIAGGFSHLQSKDPGRWEKILKAPSGGYGQQIPPPPQQMGQGGGPGGGMLNKIKVSNGQKTMLIDPADAADAAIDGFQVVK